jgi:hypothetical protein
MRLVKPGQTTSRAILATHEIRPHQVRYDLERCDPEFAAKMAEARSVYPNAASLKQTAEGGTRKTLRSRIISYDRTPDIQALVTMARELLLLSPCATKGSRAIMNTSDWER